jgi:hypothetical protein
MNGALPGRLSNLVLRRHLGPSETHLLEIGMLIAQSEGNVLDDVDGNERG